MIKHLTAIVLALVLSCGAALAQSCFPDASGSHVNCGVPVMYLNNGISIAVDTGHGLPTTGVEQADVTGTFTNATQTTSVTSTSQDGYGTALISLTGTYGTASGVFEMSDDSGTTWFPIAIARTDGTGYETGYTGLTNVSRAWLIPAAGMDLIRIRSTAVASGTAAIRISSTSVQTSPVPTTSSIIAGNATGTTGAVVGTLAAAANKTTSLCEFDVSAAGTGLIGPITIAGLLGGSRVYQITAPAIISKSFSPCLPASAANTAITITTTADATATAVDVNSSGTQQ